MVDFKKPVMPAEPSTDVEQPLARYPLSGGRLAAVALLGLGFLVTVFVVMWLWINTTPATGEQKTTAHLEVFKTTASVAVMLGGVGALYLAARRQRTQESEHTHAVRTAETNWQHSERVAAATEDDAARRRVTELYTKAGDQLGSDKAPVRLAGLYALERLAQGNPDQRQTIVNVLCAYLRMPYELPGNLLVVNDDEVTRARFEVRAQEREVRLTAQYILATHLRTGYDDHPVDIFWNDIDLDLTNATLVNFSFMGCRVRSAMFDEAHFCGEARFDGAHFDDDAYFGKARFDGWAYFDDAEFDGAAWFGEARYDGSVWFNRTCFHGDVGFFGVRFCGEAGFREAEFEPGFEFNSTVRSGGTATLIPCWVKTSNGSSIWPPGWSVIATSDLPEPDAEGLWGHLVK